MYLPTKAIRTDSLGSWTRCSRSPHSVQSTSRKGRLSRRTTYASSSSRCNTLGMS
ncbi:Uncharacterised protein [Mycobacteroides abscessus subsp. abscessus]|nr:Uncharacterised protein [Mycobacteroides abscessus subsp. abscessus]